MSAQPDSDVDRGVIPFSLRDAPSLIERIFPTVKISAEAQKERKANLGQILTVLGSFWKGRKQLILVRACVLGTLLPVSDDPGMDLHVFESLLAIDDDSFEFRVKRKADYPGILGLPYEQRMAKVYRPDELEPSAESELWEMVNDHLSTNASSLTELVEQLGIMRFGRRPVLGDTFSGGGSIPFEAARIGCDVEASDLNPIACLLTWGSLNLIGGGEEIHEALKAEEEAVVDAVEDAITRLGIEHDAEGNRAKAYLYCVEAICPETGWRVPMLTTRIVSKARNAVVDLVPDDGRQCYDFVIRSDVDADEMKEAVRGTVVDLKIGGRSDRRLIHPRSVTENGVSLTTMRGDRRGRDGARGNQLRAWEKLDFEGREDDLFRDRLYCIQWISKASFGKTRQKTWFAAPTSDDEARERRVAEIVADNLEKWMAAGFVPDMEIEEGDETSRLRRERGWTHWHHLFTPRDLVTIATVLEATSTPGAFAAVPGMLNHASKLCQWITSAPTVGDDGKQVGGARELPNHVFYNQALNTFWNYASRASHFLVRDIKIADSLKYFDIQSNRRVRCGSAADVQVDSDIYVTDPPYADAVNYHEITEFFIAWLRRRAPEPFTGWNWDSRRRLAIRGKGEDFRASMVEAYRAMAEHMPDNGVQIVMFTHQSGKVWSDMAQIFWGAGLQVMADWYIATETSSEIRKGGYVQGTHIIVLRKRPVAQTGYADEITREVTQEVGLQIEEMVGLNQALIGQGRSENLFNDADLQMAGYAAALRVLTQYEKIDGRDMTVEAMRPRTKNERTVVDEIIEYAVQVANEHLVPDGMQKSIWRRMSGSERFYLKMLDIESTGAAKLDNYQNFQKAFRVPDYMPLMGSVEPNEARLKTAVEFDKRLGDDEFGKSRVRALLYVLWEMSNGVDDELVHEHLRNLVDDYLESRDDLMAIAVYIAAKRRTRNPQEATNAEILAGWIRNERLG